MKFYVINLARSGERWRHIKKQFSKLNLSPTRIEAIDGDNLTIEQASPYRNRPRRQPMSDYEISCFLSHKICWQTIADGDDDYAFVFEDDVHISSLLPAYCLNF